MSNLLKGKNLYLSRLLNNLSLNELAVKIDKTKQYLSLLEKNDIKAIDDDLFNKLVEVLDVSSSFLADNILEIPQSNIVFFRKQKTTSDFNRDRFSFIANFVSEFFNFLQNIYDFKKINLDKIECKTNLDIENAAENTRKQLSLSLDTPINNMLTELERVGFFVVNTDFDVSEKIDSCFLDKNQKIILNNKKKFDNNSCRFRFSLAHELGHSILHFEQDELKPDIENQANYFASSFLLPRIAFFSEFSFLKDNRNISWELLYNLKKRWKVSVSCILHRAYDLGMINYEKYQRAFVEMAKRGEKKHERGDNDIKIEESKTINFLKNDLDYDIINSFIRKMKITSSMFFKIFSDFDNFLNIDVKDSKIIYQDFGKNKFYD